MVILRNLPGSMSAEKSHRTASGTPSILPKPSCRDILRNLLHSNRRSQDPWLGEGWKVANLTNYVYDGNLVLQMRENSTPVETFTRGSDLSGSLQGAGGIGGLLARTTGYSSGSWSTHDYYQADGNGNITYLELTNQTLGATYVYDPYGNVLSDSGSVANANLYRFSSKKLHAASGMYYYGYRFYIPEYQRWLNRDPAQEEGGVNLFGFVLDNPVSVLDLEGLADWSPNDTFTPDPFGHGKNPDGTARDTHIDRKCAKGGDKCRYNLDGTPRKDAPPLNKKTWPKFQQAAQKALQMVGKAAARMLMLLPMLFVPDPCMANPTFLGCDPGGPPCA